MYVGGNLYHMRNGFDRESNPQPQWWQALMLISNIDLTTAPLWQPNSGVSYPSWNNQCSLIESLFYWLQVKGRTKAATDAFMAYMPYEHMVRVFEILALNWIGKGINAKNRTMSNGWLCLSMLLKDWASVLHVFPVYSKLICSCLYVHVGKIPTLAITGFSD
jgi:hypothetical protein